MSEPTIRVLLVDDSPMVLKILDRIFAQSADVEVVGKVGDGAQALELIPKVEPSVVCTDLNMPVMDGLELTRRIMEEFPRPVLVVSDAVQQEHKQNVFDLLQAGALDVYPKPRGGGEANYGKAAEELVRKLRVLSGVKVFRKRRHRVFRGASPGARIPPAAAADGDAEGRVELVGVGASTGGPQAYLAVLSALPADFAAPIVCVQHIGTGFLGGLVKWLDARCEIRVRTAESGEQAEPGTAYFAPDDAHLVVDRGGVLKTTSEPSCGGHRPSATVTFQSLADHYRERALGVLLTGMGKDGAEGLQALVRAGGTSLVQDEETSTVFGMPKQAIELGAATHVLPLDKIGSTLKKLCRRRQK